MRRFPGLFWLFFSVSSQRGGVEAVEAIEAIDLRAQRLLPSPTEAKQLRVSSQATFLAERSRARQLSGFDSLAAKA